MSFSFGTPNTQPGFTTGTVAQPTQGGFSFDGATTGAGDANKQALGGLAQTPLQTQGKPDGQLFSTNFSAPRFGGPANAAPTFGSTAFGTPASETTSFAVSPAINQTPNIPSSTGTAALTGGLAFGVPFRGQTAASGFRPPAPSSTAPGLGALSTPSSLGFNLEAPPTASVAPTSSGISFGLAKTNAPGITSGTAAATTGGLTNLSFGTLTTTVPASGFSTGIGGTPAPTSTTGFGITGTPQPPPGGQTLATNLTPASNALGGFSLSATPTQPAQTTGVSFSLGGAATTTPAPAATGASLATPASSVSFSLGSAAPTTAAPAFNSGQTTTALNTPGFSLGQTSVPAVSTAAPTSMPQSSLGTATNVTSSTSVTSQLAGLNFCQLEESINKWTLELEEQEKAFVNQATQVNAWDRLLIANGEKIVTLNQEVERVKLEQQQLEHELDYVVGQQRELQDCLIPLEKELASVSTTDPEREYTYRLAENLDTQLKQMSEDLKEIIEHLNEANRSQDSSDPIVQIGKILNAHMNSLQWLDQRTAVLQTKIQQIDQMHQNFRQEHERSFNLAYN